MAFKEGINSTKIKDLTSGLPVKRPESGTGVLKSEQKRYGELVWRTVNHPAHPGEHISVEQAQELAREWRTIKEPAAPGTITSEQSQELVRTVRDIREATANWEGGSYGSSEPRPGHGHSGG